MAEYYLDHGAYGGSNRLGIDAPTWGVPQEGDGAATAASSAAAVAEIKINSGATASETISICGATITAAAAIGTNTFARDASAANVATNIVALINHATYFTNTVKSTVISTTGIASTSNQGRNCFYARVKPGASDTVQVMWRIGSNALNYSVNSLVDVTYGGSWSVNPTITDFTGGASGCWGWFLNEAAIGQSSSIAANSYGVWLARPTIVCSGGSSTVATIDLTTEIWIRTNTGQTVTWYAASGSVARNSNAPAVHFVFDSKLKWTGDSGTGVFTFFCNNTSAYDQTFTSYTDVIMRAIMRGGGKVKGKCATSGTYLTLGSTSSYNAEYWFDNLTIEEDTATVSNSPSSLPFPRGVGNGGCFYRVTNCDINMLQARTTGRWVTTIPSQAYGGMLFVSGCTFNFNYTGSSAITVGLCGVNGAYSSGQTPIRARFFDCSITGLGSYSQPVFYMSSAWTSTQTLYDLVAENIAGSTIDSNGLAPWSVGYNAQYCDDVFRRCSFSNAAGAWKYETQAGAVDYLPGAGYPYLSASDPSGAGGAVRLFWVPTGGGMGGHRGFTSPPIRAQMRAASGVKDITIELFIPNAITLSTSNFKLTFSYIDTSGVLRTQSFLGSDVVSSAASWSDTGSFSGHSAKKLTFTTDYSIQQYTMMSILVHFLVGSPTGTLQYLFVDPAVGVA